jgi:hypothetical protein
VELQALPRHHPGRGLRHECCRGAAPAHVTGGRGRARLA